MKSLFIISLLINLFWSQALLAIQVEAKHNQTAETGNSQGFLDPSAARFKLSLTDIQAEITSSNNLPIQTGIVYELPNPINSNQLSWSAINNGYVAYIHLQASQALKLRLHLSNIVNANAIILQLKGSKDSQIIGPVTLETIQNQEIWLPVSKGDNCDLEIFIANGNTPEQVNFILDSINYINADTSSNKQYGVSSLKLAKNTEYDLSCYSSNTNYPGIELAAAATAKINFIKDNQSYICTGTLLNDQNSTQTPWFFTANHCLTNQTVASTASFEWFFQATSCGGSQNDPRYAQTYGGATLLWTDFKLEASFLKLNKPPANNVIFSGWNTAVNTGETVWGVHHPRGDHTMVSMGKISDLLITVTDVSQGGSHLLDEITYSKGGIEPGSSGSGLFVITGSTAYWVGTLFGANPSNYQSASYSHFQNYFSHVSAWLTPPKPTVTFSAKPTIVSQGQTSALTWSSTNSNSCTASGGWSGTKASSGSQNTVALSNNQTYTLNCSGGGSNVSSSVNVAVKPTLSFSAAANTVSYNGQTTLTWSSQNATSCSATGSWSGNQAASGSLVVSSLTSAKTYNLQCTGSGGTVNGVVTVNIVPTISLSASPGTVAANAKTTLSWASTNTTSCTATGGWTGTKAVSGTFTSNALTNSQTYQLSCSGPGGSASNSVTVNVVPIINISASPTIISSGGKSTINWSTINATSCTASGDWSGSKSTSGSQSTGAITTNQTYTLKCSGPGGNSSSLVTVAVKPSLSFSANTNPVNYNTGTALTWSSQNATSCSASGSWSGTLASSGNQTINNLTTAKTYNLLCTGLGGTVNSTVTVNIIPTLTFSASPSTVAYNGTTTLSWTSTNSTSCNATGGWTGSKALSGTFRTGALTSNQNYQLNCTGPGGTVSSSLVENVTPMVSLTAYPTSIKSGKSSTLNWSTSNSNSCNASGGWTGNQASKGSLSTGILTTNQSYILSCSNSAGTVSATATITVTK